MGEKRRDARYVVEVDARMRNGTGSARRIKMTDVSRRGCRITIPGTGLGPDAFITITVASLDFIVAQVKWRAGRVYGLSFPEALHPAVVDYIRHSLSRQAPVIEQASAARVLA
jgi:hypothetical protein